MSLAGLRDISVIETPPEGRRPVKTYVGEYDEELVKRAIERELDRGGPGLLPAQPRGHDRRDRRAGARDGARTRACWWPTARWTRSSWSRRCWPSCAARPTCWCAPRSSSRASTSPTANTLIVERADELGLAQLYQIRGRVGRSRERAYAYLLYPSAAALTEEAAARLSTLSDYTELGSGFKIAMRDLEIRGAGNLLGDEQSGHVAAVGFELYVSMLDEAVAALAGDSGRRGARAGARGPAGRRLRARRLRALRGGQDRGPPARGGRAARSPT